MADVKQIYEIVNSITEQALGTKGLTPTDVSFVSVGKNVLSSEVNKELWYKTLFDRIAKTVIAVKAYTANTMAMRKEGVEYGIAVQKLSYGLLTAKENTSWKDQASNPFAKFNDNKVVQMIFSDFTTWEIDMSVPDIQLKTAFTSAVAMGAFINGLMTTLHNSMEFKIEQMSNLCMASYIARKSVEGGLKYVNLLHDYNTATNSNLTVESCLKDVDFLKYASMTINTYSSRMTRFSKLFNNGEVERFTAKESQNLTVLDYFANACKFYLQADTFHKELVSLPNYNETPFWQGSGTSYSFADVSSIKVQLENTGSETSVTGIVAVLNDVDGLGITVDNRRTTTAYNSKDEFVNYFAKADIGYYNDMTENGIVFYLAEV